MAILYYAILGFIIGRGLGSVALLVGMGAYGAWNTLLEWIGDMRWCFGWWRTQRRWARDGKPASVVLAEQQMAHAAKLLSDAMPTMQEVADGLASMHKVRRDNR